MPLSGNCARSWAPCPNLLAPMPSSTGHQHTLPCGLGQSPIPLSVSLVTSAHEITASWITAICQWILELSESSGHEPCVVDTTASCVLFPPTWEGTPFLTGTVVGVTVSPLSHKLQPPPGMVLGWGPQ